MYAKIKNTNLTPYKLTQLINEWVFNTPARVTARKLGLNRNTVNLWYGRIRRGIFLLPDPGPFSGEVEIDESYFGRRNRLSGPGLVQGQTPVFGLRERSSGLVIAVVVTGTRERHLLPLIRKHVAPQSIIYSDGFGAYHHLPAKGYAHRVILHEYAFVNQYRVHTNGIESFWAYTKHMLSGRKGLNRSSYPEHIKEAQIRFNTSHPRVLRGLVRKILRSEE